MSVQPINPHGGKHCWPPGEITKEILIALIQKELDRDLGDFTEAHRLLKTSLKYLSEESQEELENSLAKKYARLPKLDSIQKLFYDYIERKNYEEAMKDAPVPPHPYD